MFQHVSLIIQNSQLINRPVKQTTEKAKKLKFVQNPLCCSAGWIFHATHIIVLITLVCTEEAPLSIEFLTQFRIPQSPLFWKLKKFRADQATSPYQQGSMYPFCLFLYTRYLSLHRGMFQQAAAAITIEIILRNIFFTPCDLFVYSQF